MTFLQVFAALIAAELVKELYRYWLTRRYAKRMAGQITQLLAEHGGGPELRN